MTWRERISTGRLGRRIRNGFVAAVLFAICSAAWHMLRNPEWDGWLDVFTWSQLFLYAPTLFFAGATVWQFICLAIEWVCRKTKTQTQSAILALPSVDERTLSFWLRDSLRILLLYVAACTMGDIPMVVRYLSAVLKWPFHIWWSNAVNASLILTIILWILLDHRWSDRINPPTS
jgi:hypothetical protein